MKGSFRRALTIWTDTPGAFRSRRYHGLGSPHTLLSSGEPAREESIEGVFPALECFAWCRGARDQHRDLNERGKEHVREHLDREPFVLAGWRGRDGLLEHPEGVTLVDLPPPLPPKDCRSVEEHDLTDDWIARLA